MEMTDVLMFIIKWMLGPIVALAVPLLLGEPLKNWLAPFAARFGSKKATGVTGKWEATFSWGPKTEPYVEIIEVSSLFGFVVGRIFPHPKNYPALRKAEYLRPVRLRGTVSNNRYFTGVWIHPLKHAHYHGAFELLIHQDGEQMQGMWLGYSEGRNTIECEKWVWKRIE